MSNESERYTSEKAVIAQLEDGRVNRCVVLALVCFMLGIVIPLIPSLGALLLLVTLATCRDYFVHNSDGQQAMWPGWLIAVVGAVVASGLAAQLTEASRLRQIIKSEDEVQAGMLWQFGTSFSTMQANRTRLMAELDSLEQAHLPSNAIEPLGKVQTGWFPMFLSTFPRAVAKDTSVFVPMLRTAECMDRLNTTIASREQIMSSGRDDMHHLERYDRLILNQQQELADWMEPLMARIGAIKTPPNSPSEWFQNMWDGIRRAVGYRTPASIR